MYKYIGYRTRDSSGKVGERGKAQVTGVPRYKTQGTDVGERGVLRQGR